MDKNCHKNKRVGTKLLAGTIVISLMALQIESAWALPQGGQVVSGQADIVNVSANELQIRQASQRAVIDWQSFDIGANEAVHILQVDNLAQTLNRVVGAAGATEIFGTLSANGTVILTNAAGFLCGPHAALDVHALVVTTADVGNEEFMNDTDGVLHFDLGSEVLNAGIVNQGTITAAEGGLVSFVAPSVQNQGLIRARLGKIELASANTFTLDLYGDELIQLGVDDRVLRDVTGLDGEVLSAAVANSGSLMADGGQVIISAEAARDVVNQVVNLSGVVQARSVDEQEGKIVLRAGDYGTVALSGRLDVSSATGAGGRIDVSGQEVNLAGASLHASGVTQGGLVRVGGAFQGGNVSNTDKPYYETYVGRWGNLTAIANATHTTVDAGSRIDVSASGGVGASAGKGGTAVVWADNTTSFLGDINALGNTQGGSIEVSGAEHLRQVNIAGLRTGQGGHVLLDPKNITIGSSGVAPDSSNDGFSDSASQDVTFAPDDVEALLFAGTNVTLQANNDLSVNSSTVVGDGGGQGALTLQAGRSILINANLRTNGGAATLEANVGTGDGVQDTHRDVGTATITMGSSTDIDTDGGNLVLRINDGAGLTNSASGDIQLRLVDATGNGGSGDLTIINNGPTAGSGIEFISAGSGSFISVRSSNTAVLVGDHLTNNNTIADPLTASSGGAHIQVWTVQPADNSLGNIGNPDFVHYNASHGVTTPGQASGVGFMYSNVTPTLNISLTGSTTKQYDATNVATLAQNNYSATGGQAGDSLTFSSTSTYDNASVGVGKTVTASSISVAATANSGGTSVYGYQLTADSANAAMGTITTKALSLSGLAASDKTYDANTTATINNYGSLTGVLGGDTVSLNSAGASSSFADANVGAGKAVTVSGLLLSGAEAGNYSIANHNTTADITAKALNLSGLAVDNKTYDATTAAVINSFGSLVGVISGDTVTLNSSSASSSFADANVGAGKAVTVSGLALSGAEASNYSIANHNTTADITALALNLSGLAVDNKTYDATTAAVINTYGSLSGVISGDTVTLNSSSASSSFADANVGSGKTVTVSGLLLSGAEAGNYSIANHNTTADITAKALNLSGLTADNKTYDATTAAVINTYGSLLGVISGDTVTLNSSSASSSFADANVGSGKTVTVSGLLLSGAEADNYSIVVHTTIADINPRSLSLSGSRYFNGTTAVIADDLHLANLVVDETLVLTGVGETSDRRVGENKPISLASLTLADGDNGGLASNYTLDGGNHVLTIYESPASEVNVESNIVQQVQSPVALSSAEVVQVSTSLPLSRGQLEIVLRPDADGSDPSSVTDIKNDEVNPVSVALGRLRS